MQSKQPSCEKVYKSWNPEPKYLLFLFLKQAIRIFFKKQDMQKKSRTDVVDDAEHILDDSHNRMQLCQSREEEK